MNRCKQSSECRSSEKRNPIELHWNIYILWLYGIHRTPYISLNRFLYIFYTYTKLVTYFSNIGKERKRWIERFVYMWYRHDFKSIYCILYIIYNKKRNACSRTNLPKTLVWMLFLLRMMKLYIISENWGIGVWGNG